jgi:hypothetical protein
MNNDGDWVDLTFENMTELPASNIKVVRTTPYSRGPIITDTYYFDGSASKVELFPVRHEVNILNGAGYIYQYEVRDLIYDGATIKDVSSPMSFGRNMKVEWDDKNYWSTVYASGILKVRYRPDSDNVTYSVRLFDPFYRTYNITSITRVDYFFEKYPTYYPINSFDLIAIGELEAGYSAYALIKFDISDLFSYPIISSESNLTVNLLKNLPAGDSLTIDAYMVYENWSYNSPVNWNGRPGDEYLSSVLDSYTFTGSDNPLNTWYSFNITDAVSRNFALNISEVTIYLKYSDAVCPYPSCYIEFYSVLTANPPYISTALNLTTVDPVINSSRTLPTLAYETNNLMGYCSANTTLSVPYTKIYYKWYKNGTLNESGNISGTFNGSQEYYVTNVSSSLTIGDEWIFSCLASDGVQNSSWINSSTVLVLNSSLSNLSLSIASIYSDITAEIGATILTGINKNYQFVCIDIVGYEDGKNVSCGVSSTSYLFEPAYFTKSSEENYTLLYTEENTNKTFYTNVLKGDIPTNITFNISGGEYNSTFPSNIKIYAGDTLIDTISSIAESFNPIVINSTVISNYIGNNSGYYGASMSFPNYIRLPINISSATQGELNVTDIVYNAITENETFDIMVHFPYYNQYLTRQITFYHSPFDSDMPPKISQMDFYPSRPTSTNVVPFGQKSSVPFYNITSYNYGGKTANLSIYLKSPTDYIVDRIFVDNTYSFTYSLPLERLPSALETRVNNWSNIDLITCFNGTDYTEYDPDDPSSATCNSIDSGDILTITLKERSFFSITKGQLGIDENTWFTYSGDYTAMPYGIKNIISNWSDVESIVCKDYSYITYIFNTSLPASENNLTYIDYGYNCTINLTSNSSFNIYYPYAPVTCVDLTVSNTSTKAEGTPLQQDVWTSIMTGLVPETNLGLWFWADYNCTYDNFFVWYPDIYLRMCAEGVDYCSEELI